MNEINKEEFKKDIENYAKVLFRKSIKEASDQEKFQAVSYAVKDIVVDQWMATHKTYEEQDVKTVYYLSMEFLTGRALGNIIINLKGNKAIKEAVEELGMRIRSRMQHLVTVVLDVWLHVSWTHCLHWDILHMDVVSVINMVCSNRLSRMVIRSRNRMTG